MENNHSVASAAGENQSSKQCIDKYTQLIHYCAMEVSIEPMTIDHYHEAITLWKESEHVGMSGADERGHIESYLARNPAMSFVATDKGRIIGAVLCGHDGRRGYLHHLAVAQTHQKKGIGKKLTETCLQSLKNVGIQKCHLFVYQTNREGKAFWQKLGWSLRSDIQVVSKDL
jgi:putative acetyltransferase